ncbi:unnamed protein product [Trichobilharzia regenti]|nr:unnamed protein product [Trichobilharzia regenti]
MTDADWSLGCLQGRHLGRLNPSLYLSEETEDLYEIQPGHIGRVWFSVSYNKRMELLKVTIHKARNLRQMSINSKSQYVGSSSVQSGTFSEEHATVDYRVKVFIEQAEKKCHVTAIKKHTINPDFNESFCFQQQTMVVSDDEAPRLVPMHSHASFRWQNSPHIFKKPKYSKHIASDQPFFICKNSLILTRKSLICMLND